MEEKISLSQGFGCFLAKSLKFRKKPVEIEAFQMTVQRLNYKSTWPTWLIDAWNKKLNESGAMYMSHEGSLRISTVEGLHTVAIGDYIIRRIAGELYPCKPDIFEKTYEEC